MILHDRTVYRSDKSASATRLYHNGNSQEIAYSFAEFILLPFESSRNLPQAKKQSYRRLSEEESIDIYREFIEDGLTQKKIAEKHCVARETVRRHILKQIKNHRINLLE